MSDGAAPSPIADRRSGKRGVARHPYGMQQQGRYGHEKRRVDDKVSASGSGVGQTMSSRLSIAQLLDEPIRQRYLKGELCKGSLCHSLPLLTPLPHIAEIGDIFAQPAAPAT